MFIRSVKIGKFPIPYKASGLFKNGYARGFILHCPHIDSGRDGVAGKHRHYLIAAEASPGYENTVRVSQGF